MIYETGKVDFDPGDASKAVTFAGEYTVIPVVNATVHDSSLNINITIQDITIIGFTMLSSDVPGSTMTVNYIIFGE
jgi:hypothetical protein